MKKILIVGLLAISAIGFANGYGHGGRNGGYRGNCGGMNGHRGGNMYGGMNGHMNNGRNLTDSEIRENRKNSVVIQEKELEIRKLMSENNVDWTRVEALDSELSRLRSTHRIERMKRNYTSNNVAQ